MTIAEIINDHYEELKSMCKNTNTVVSCHRTSEDVFQDVMVMALNKYKDRKISEDEGIKYLRKSLAMELYFQWNKIDNNNEVLMGDLKCPPPEDLLL